MLAEVWWNFWRQSGGIWWHLNIGRTEVILCLHVIFRILLNIDYRTCLRFFIFMFVKFWTISVRLISKKKECLLRNIGRGSSDWFSEKKIHSEKRVTPFLSDFSHFWKK
jgi:hypothetical protein